MPPDYHLFHQRATDPPFQKPLLERTSSRDPLFHTVPIAPRAPLLGTAFPLQPRIQVPKPLERKFTPLDPFPGVRGSARWGCGWGGGRVSRGPQGPPRAPTPTEVCRGRGARVGGTGPGWGRGESEEEGEEGEEECVCERVWLGEAIACLIVAVAALPLLSQLERHEWPGPAAAAAAAAAAARRSQTQREVRGSPPPPAAPRPRRRASGTPLAASPDPLRPGRRAPG